jgi:hypothetical protein
MSCEHEIDVLMEHIAAATPDLKKLRISKFLPEPTCIMWPWEASEDLVKLKYLEVLNIGLSLLIGCNHHTDLLAPPFSNEPCPRKRVETAGLSILHRLPGSLHELQFNCLDVGLLADFDMTVLLIKDFVDECRPDGLFPYLKTLDLSGGVNCIIRTWIQRRPTLNNISKKQV